MELQIPLVERILADHPNTSYDIWNLARRREDNGWLRYLEVAPPMTVRHDFYHTRPKWLGYQQIYQHYADPEYRDCLFVKIDDDVVFLETDRFGKFIDEVAANPGAIVSGDVVNNGACARRQPIWDRFDITGIPLLDWHKHVVTAELAHNYFLDRPKSMLRRPVQTVSTDDWLSINCVGFDWETCRQLAEMIGTPSPAQIAGRQFRREDMLGDEGAANMFPRKIVRGFTAAHLSFGPQNLSIEQLDDWVQRYGELGRKYLASEALPAIRRRAVSNDVRKGRILPFYEVLRPCAYVFDDQPVLHKTPGAVVELTAEAAAYLGSRVRPVAPPAAATPTPEPTPQLSEKGQP
jgi:hypothetical protein